ncbi:hypothetical protein GQ600_20915 [Phytophthora cactorum]|nr:hypothetical protein GQ600_20915 [Phytophthora cactorum]
MRFRSFEDPNTQAFARGNSTEESAYAEIESTTYAIPSSSGFDRHTSATACNGYVRQQQQDAKQNSAGEDSDAAQRSPTKTNQDNLSRTGFTTLKSLLRRLEISLDSQQDFEQLSWQLVSILTQIESPDACATLWSRSQVCGTTAERTRRRGRNGSRLSQFHAGVSIETFDDVQHYLEQFREDVEKEKKMEKEEEKDSSLELLGSPTLQNLWNEGKMDDDELLLSPIHSGSGDVSQYSLRQVDRFRVTAINQSSSDTDPKRKYCDCGEWICVITSEYG